MIEEIRNIKSSKKELKKFGLTLGAVVLVWAALLVWHGKSWYKYLIFSSPVLVILGLFCPIVLKPVHKVFNTLFIFINWLVTHTALVFLFYLVITPIGLMAKLFKKDFLNLSFKDDTESYWISKRDELIEKESYTKQF